MGDGLGQRGLVLDEGPPALLLGRRHRRRVEGDDISCMVNGRMHNLARLAGLGWGEQAWMRCSDCSGGR